MTDRKELLKSMLNNLINDKQEDAAVDAHNYLSAKMKDVAGGGKEQIEEPDIKDDVEEVIDAE